MKKFKIIVQEQENGVFVDHISQETNGAVVIFDDGDDVQGSTYIDTKCDRITMIANVAEKFSKEIWTRFIAHLMDNLGTDRATLKLKMTTKH